MLSFAALVALVATAFMLIALARVCSQRGLAFTRALVGLVIAASVAAAAALLLAEAPAPSWWRPWEPLARAGAGGALVGGALALAMSLVGTQSGWKRLIVLLLPLYARWSRSTVLAHEARSAILDHVARTPGIHIRQVSRDLGLGVGATTYHLEVLERAGLLSSTADGRTRRYTAASAARDAKAFGRAGHQTARSILEYVSDHPSCTQAEVRAGLDLSASLVGWHAQRLADVGLLDAHRQGRHVRYAVTESWQRIGS